MRTMFASLSIPNYRIYFSGTLLTNMGQWMARTAQSGLVLVISTSTTRCHALASIPHVI